MARPAIDMTGRVIGMLRVLRRSGTHANSEAMWLCLCECGREKPVAGAHLRSGGTKSCGCSRWPRKTDAEIGYPGAHGRIRRARGTASDYNCVDCDSHALDWSLRRDSPKTYLGVKNGSACFYSGDPNDYDPRCRQCHTIYDRGGVA